MLVTRKNIQSLFEIKDHNCISIYIPTHRSGFENSRIDQLNFKNALSEARRALEENRTSPQTIHKILHPAYELLDDENFWPQLSDGLAVFISPDHFEYFELPVSFNIHVHVGQEYYLRPLLPMFTGNGRFFLLALSQNEVRFFEGYRSSITPVIIEDLVPANLEEAHYFGEQQSTLQAHSHEGAEKTSIYHGHGGGKDDKQMDIRKYFRQIDQGLMEMLHDENAPLLIASVDYLAPIYREISDYSNIIEANISGNPEHLSPAQLHERAWQIMQPHFSTEREKAKKQFDHKFAKHEATISTHDIVPASINGRIETLFIDKNTTNLWGAFDPKTNQVKLHENRRENSKEVLNQVAVQTFLQGGTVYNVEAEEMPFPFALMNAITRY